MKVLVLGGYGVFGERVVRLLRRDGHQVVVAGRDLASARRLADAVGAEALRFDRHADVDRLPALAPDVLIDAAGPFHAYGAQPYALASACLAAGIHYLDLADDAAFCTGIAALDALAREHGRVALSGASSVPAISAAATHALRHGMQSIESIDTAILPGNRAPRGLSVIASILAQCGHTRRIWLDGAWQTMRGWSAPRRYLLGPFGVRSGYRIGVPDLDLFPAHFAARSVSFRAGLELGLMNRGLTVLARLRARWPFAIGPGFARALRMLAELLKPFGSDRGGMRVELIGRLPGQGEFDRCRRRWTLLAERGDGPWVPAMPVRALLRKPWPEAGARACLDALSLDELQAAMADCRIRCVRDADSLRALFASVPGLALDTLPEPIRASHSVFHTRVLRGRATVERGTGWLARLLCALLRFPRADADVAATVIKTREDGRECWQRRFAEHGFRSHLRIVDGYMRERFGPLEFELGLHIADASLHFPVRRSWLLGLRLPGWLLPHSEAREYVENGQFRFDVALDAPLSLGRIIRYRGHLATEGSSARSAAF